MIYYPRGYVCTSHVYSDLQCAVNQKHYRRTGHFYQHLHDPCLTVFDLMLNNKNNF